MQGRKDIQPKMMYQVNLEELVSPDNFYRQLDSVIDLRFLYKSTANYYGREGQESIDPIVFFKICLIGYLNNISSDRKLIAYCANCLDTRLYLKYDLDEPLPWHSTISRTRSLYGEEVFMMLFKKVLSLCVAKGMVRGKRQAIDSAFIKANASMDSLVEKEVLDDADFYAEELNDNSEYKVSNTRKKLVDSHHSWKEEEYNGQPGKPNSTGHSNKINNTDEHGNLIRPKYLSNHTHYSPTDPDARISVKPGKARQMNYYGQLAVDDGQHVITAARADYADKRDSQCLPAILSQAIYNLKENDITIEQIAADTAYSSGESLQFLENKNIDAYIPNFGQYKPERPGFIFNKEQDQYECQRGNKAILTFRNTSTDSKGYTKKIYRSSETVCKDCPLRSQCCGKSTKYKKLDDSIYKPYYDKMHEKLYRDITYAKRISRIRSRTVEPVLGTLINFVNMKRVNTRGIRNANKHVLMSALTYNLKKYFKFITKKRTSKVQAIDNTALNQLKSALHNFISSIISPLQFTNS